MAARIGQTTNFYRLGAGAALRRERLAGYLDARAEATATIVHRLLAELGLADQVLLWNVVPTHPGTDRSNRRPTRAEVAAGLQFAEELAAGRRVIAVGRIAASALGAPYIRHPAHGGLAEFREGLLRFAPGGRSVRPFFV